jgi:hypothetical protein
MLHTLLLGAGQANPVPQFEAVRQLGAFHPLLSLLTSLLSGAGLLFAAARQLATVDY